MAEFAIYKPDIRIEWKPKERIGLAAEAGSGAVVVRTPNWLGDAVMALPAVWQISDLTGPDMKLAVICPQALMPIWQAAPWVEHVIPLDGKRVKAGAAARIRELNPAAGVVLPNSFGSALDIFKCKVPVRVVGPAEDGVCCSLIPLRAGKGFSDMINTISCRIIWR